MVLTLPKPTEEAELEVLALFEEAKARRRRRWVLGGSIALLVLALVVGAVAVSTTPSSSPRSIASSGSHTGSAAPDSPASSIVAWVDYYGDLHIGSPDGTNQRVVRKIQANPTTPLVWVAGRLFWAGNCSDLAASRCYSSSSGFPLSQVQEYDPVSNRLRSLATGSAVFASVDGLSVFVVGPRLDCPPTTGSCDRNAEQLSRIPIDTSGKRETFDVPSGWYVGSGAGLGDPMAVRQGVLVQSRPAQNDLAGAKAGSVEPENWSSESPRTRLGPCRVAHDRPQTRVTWPGCRAPVNVRRVRVARCSSLTRRPSRASLSGALFPMGSTLVVPSRPTGGNWRSS